MKVRPSVVVSNTSSFEALYSLIAMGLLGVKSSLPSAPTVQLWTRMPVRELLDQSMV